MSATTPFPQKNIAGFDHNTAGQRGSVAPLCCFWPDFSIAIFSLAIYLATRGRSRISVREDIFDARGDPGSEAGKTMLKRQSPPPQKKGIWAFLITAPKSNAEALLFGAFFRQISSMPYSSRSFPDLKADFIIIFTLQKTNSRRIYYERLVDRWSRIHCIAYNY